MKRRLLENKKRDKMDEKERKRVEYNKRVI
jgi:hypothetical protein